MSKFQGALIGSTKAYSSKTPVAVHCVSGTHKHPKVRHAVVVKQEGRQTSYGYLKINIGVCTGLNSTYVTWSDKTAAGLITYFKV